MYDLDDLYQEVVMDHNRRPRNYRKPECTNRQVEGFNPLCGDQITIYLSVQDNKIADIGFQAIGCAISKASASMMTESVKGLSLEEAGLVTTTSFVHFSQWLHLLLIVEVLSWL